MIGRLLPLLAALAAAAVPLAGRGAATPSPLPDDSEAFRIAGLAAPVDILIDRYGVPHSYAGNEPDL